jgi:hypothetical protein
MHRVAGDVCYNISCRFFEQMLRFRGSEAVRARVANIVMWFQIRTSLIGHDITDDTDKTGIGRSTAICRV